MVRGLPGFARARRAVACAVVCVAAACALSSCAASRNYDAADFPKAVSAGGGVDVTWKGKLLDMRYGARTRSAGAVYLDGGGKWMLEFRVVESRPRIPPFIQKRRAVIVLGNPLLFFQTNDFRVGQSIEKTFRVWRGGDGLLRGQSP